MKLDALPPEDRSGFFAWFTSNHVAATLVAIGFAVAGMSALFGDRVRREVFPELAPNVINVTVAYPGAAPSEIEQGICLRVEDAVDGITGVDKITATASEGVGTVVVETLQEADIDRVYDDIKNRVDGITSFPVDAEEPIVSRMVVRRQVINVSVHGDASEATLKHIAEQVRDELSDLPEISQAELAAVRPYEIAIEVSEEDLQRHGLTFDAVANAVRRSSLDLPTGAIRAREGDTVLRVQSQAYRGEEFAELVLLTQTDGTRIRLGDVANVVDGFEETDQKARFDGSSAALVKVFRVGDQDAIRITNAVKDWVATAGKRLVPPGVELTTWRDESIILQGRIDLLTRNAMQGLALVLVILALFLQLRLALWVALGIPIGFLGTVAFMPVFDVSINMISLFAFLLVLGIVVDDAIVVGENIGHHRRQGTSPLLASIRGAREVRKPVFASIATTIAAFLPMLLSVPGTDAQVWRVIPLIVIPVLVISLIESQLCLPSHLSLMKLDAAERRPWIGARALGWVQSRFDGLLETFIQRIYQPIVDTLLRWRYATLAGALAALIVGFTSLIAGGYPRFIFFPSVEGDNIVVALTMPEGTPVADTVAHLARIENAARTVCDEFEGELGGQPILKHMLATVGSQPFAEVQARNAGQRSQTFGSGSHLAELDVQLVPSEEREIASDIVMARFRELVGTIPGATELTFSTSFFSTGKDVDVELYHRDGDQLEAAAAALTAKLNAIPEVKDVTSSFRLGKPELQIAIRPAAETLGLTQIDLARQVRQAFYGEEAQRIQRGRDDVRVMVRYPEADRRTLTDLRDLRVRTLAGDEVPFTEVATLDHGRSYSSITRVDGRRTLRISGDVEETNKDASPNAINAQLRAEILPALVAQFPGLGWGFEGDEKNRRELFSSLAGGYLIALFAMFAMIAISLRSFLQPFLMLAAVPFGLLGAILGHMIEGYDVSILSAFGGIALSGIVVNDNIVLVDWINRRREAGDSLLDAVKTAGARRFRPILLTSLTTTVGLVPLMYFEKSVQALFLVPMAVALAYGVVFATVVSLVLVPTMYLILEDFRAGLRRVGRALSWVYGGDTASRPTAADARP